MRKYQKQEPYTDITPEKLDILTHRQCQTLLMRDQSHMTYTQIGEALGIHPNAAREHYKNALRRLHEYDNTMARDQYNLMVVELPLNRAELLTIEEGLDNLSRRPSYRGIQNCTWDWEEHRPYKYQLLTNLLERVKQVIAETSPNAKKD